MQILITFFALIFGIIVGSFLNVVILRMNTGRTIGGRSFCFSCRNQLSWYELVPLASFLVQRGKCRSCRSKISWQYPLVELVTGLLFAGFVWFSWGAFFLVPLSLFISQIVLWMFIISCGVVISVYDIRHKLIHIQFLVAFFIGIVVMFFLQGSMSFLFLGKQILASLIVASPFLVMWLVSKGRWIGFGDIEIMAIAGFMLGIVDGFTAVIFGFWIACAVMVPVVIYTRYKKLHTHPQIPFAPFLFLGMYVVAILGIRLFNFF